MAVRIDFHGRLSDAPRIRVGFIGCGSHAFRNIYPVLQFTPTELVATCDLDAERAAAFARQFGAERNYADYRTMLEREQLDAVLVVLNYDERGRPRYPQVACDCLAAGCHVWIEKPPAATCADVETMIAASEAAQRHVVVGFKKMFAPANAHAMHLRTQPDFGRTSLVTLRYPQYIPPVAELRRYLAGENVPAATGFLDHLCHPMSLLIGMLGMPAALRYERSAAGGGVATFRYTDGCVASLLLAHRGCEDGGMERTDIISDCGREIVVENNVRLSYHRNPPVPADQGYGSQPSFYHGDPGQTTAVWQPEFSLGQLYNKGLFLLGYYDEVNELARVVLDKRPPTRGTLRQAWQVTRVFEAFAGGPGVEVALPPDPPASAD